MVRRMIRLISGLCLGTSQFQYERLIGISPANIDNVPHLTIDYLRQDTIHIRRVEPLYSVGSSNIPFISRTDAIEVEIFHSTSLRRAVASFRRSKMDEKFNSKQSCHLDEQVAESIYIKPQARKLYDPEVTFEEYYYYAQKTREEEEQLEAPKLQWRELMSGKSVSHNASGDQTQTDRLFANRESRLQISDEEWTNASRSFRTASAGAIFYLVRQ